MTVRYLSCLGLVFVLTACSGPGYYLQAVSGQWELMHSRQSVQTLLDHPDTETALIKDLQTANQILEFADDSLGLPSGGSYTSYVQLEANALVWNVVATEEFSLQAKTWCFLVAGCVPYRGFFKQDKAEYSSSKLRNKGMDVVVAPAGAYSTLGWFDDPLLSSMFAGSDVRLAAYLFHELAHQRIYLKDDSQFNEGYASFVEEIGLKTWLISRQKQNEIEKWQQQQDASNDFSELVSTLQNNLEELYKSDQSQANKRQLKADAFESFRHAYDQLSQDKWQGKRYYANWFNQPLNNAKIALFSTYEGSFCAFQNLLDQSEGDIEVFHHLAEQQSKSPSALRQQWLKQSCSAKTPRDGI